MEVLKGPQGTLWGRNTTGGLINYKYRKTRPGDETSGYVNAGYAEFGDLNVEAAIGGTITDQLAVRVAGRHNSTNGYFESTAPGIVKDDFDASDEYAIRATIVYTPTERLTIEPSVNYSISDGVTAMGTIRGIDNNNLTPGCSNPGQLNTTCADNFGHIFTDNYKVDAEFPPSQDVESFGVSGKINYEMGDLSISSTTAFQSGDFYMHADEDNTPFGILNSHMETRYESISQEIKLASDYEGRFNWIGGVFYLSDELDMHDGGGISLFGGGTARQQVVGTETISVFGEVTYDLTDRLELILGGRWTEDQRKVDARAFRFFHTFTRPGTRAFAAANFNPAAAGGLQGANLEASAGEPSGRFSLKYGLNDDTNLWMTVSRGFKGGDSNSGARATNDYNISKPEFEL